MATNRPTLLLLLLICVLGWTGANTLSKRRYCESALGMEDGTISDDAITASASRDHTVGPENGRLFLESGGGAWCPPYEIGSGLREQYLQVVWPTEHEIHILATQGRFHEGKADEYSPYVKVQYRDGDEWIPYESSRGETVFEANTNTYEAVFIELEPSIITDGIRVIPWSTSAIFACLRIEVYGCEAVDYDDGDHWVGTLYY